jgi:hypothetical protein
MVFLARKKRRLIGRRDNIDRLDGERLHQIPEQNQFKLWQASFCAQKPPLMLAAAV